VSKKIISYWLDSLAMADQLQESNKFTASSNIVETDRASLADGRLTEAAHSQIQQLLEKQQQSSQKLEEQTSNKILLFPFVLKRHPRDERPLIPLWIPALITNEQGIISPDPEHQPWIPRQLINPESLEVNIGDAEKFDDFFYENSLPTEWKKYWRFCTRLLEHVTGKTWLNFHVENYQTLEESMILPNNVVSGPSKPVQELYRKVLDRSNRHSARRRVINEVG
jgi:hypothetical protein